MLFIKNKILKTIRLFLIQVKVLSKILAKDSNKIGSKSIKYGLNSLLTFFIIFLSWAIFIPIKSASIAEGIVVLDFNKKTIQHLEGGIIDQILVKEGQMVGQGERLLYLHDIKAKSEYQSIIKKLWTSKIQKERLIAEKDQKPAINLSKLFDDIGEIEEVDQQELKEIIDNQNKLFEARRNKNSGEIEVLKEKLNSTEIQKKSAKRKLAIYHQEADAINVLVDEDNLPLSRKLDLEKNIADLESKIAELNEGAASTKLQIANYKNDNLSKILDEIKETELEIIHLSNQLPAVKDSLKRSEIVSPVAGKVMNIKYHTIGAVVPPGGEIMNIVPQHEELIIEAKVKPQDIDEVHFGLKAKIMLTAYKGKKVPKLNGEVLNVSPDIITNDQTRESYFLARIKIDEKEIEKLKEKIELYPGMPSQVFIITGGRSLVSYLFTPLKDAAYKSFRE